MTSALASSLQDLDGRLAARLLRLLAQQVDVRLHLVEPSPGADGVPRAALTSLPRGRGRPISRGRRWARRMAPSAGSRAPAPRRPRRRRSRPRQALCRGGNAVVRTRALLGRRHGVRTARCRPLGLLAGLGQLVGQAAELLSGLLDLLGHRLQAQALARDGDAEHRAPRTEHALAEDHAADEPSRRGTAGDDRRARLLRRPSRWCRSRADRAIGAAAVRRARGARPRRRSTSRCANDSRSRPPRARAAWRPTTPSATRDLAGEDDRFAAPALLPEPALRLLAGVGRALD